ncbi:MAG: DUF3493 domain-containing protein [Synechococcus sp.]
MPSPDSLDPDLRRRLLQEARTPWRGLRRGLWFALLASAAIGLATMLLRLSAGDVVSAQDLIIQVVALLVCAGLIWWDRNRSPDGDARD